MKVGTRGAPKQKQRKPAPVAQGWRMSTLYSSVAAAEESPYNSAAPLAAAICDDLTPKDLRRASSREDDNSKAYRRKGLKKPRHSRANSKRSAGRRKLDGARVLSGHN